MLTVVDSLAEDDPGLALEAVTVEESELVATLANVDETVLPAVVTKEIEYIFHEISR